MIRCIRDKWKLSRLRNIMRIVWQTGPKRSRYRQTRLNIYSANCNNCLDLSFYDLINASIKSFFRSFSFSLAFFVSFGSHTNWNVECDTTKTAWMYATFVRLIIAHFSANIKFYQMHSCFFFFCFHNANGIHNNVIKNNERHKITE